MLMWINTMSNENRKFVNMNDRQRDLLELAKQTVAKKIADKTGYKGKLYNGDIIENALEVLLGKKHYIGSKDWYDGYRIRQ